MTISGSKAASLLPFGYLAVTRIRGVRDLAYHVATSWLPAIWLVVRLTDLGPAMATGQFLLGYLAFIAAYEIGYLANDAWDSKRSSNGRERVRFPIDGIYVALFLLVRLGVWALVAMVTGWFENLLWLAGYGVLVIAFAQHNLVQSRGLRLASFYELATLRFLLPVTAILSADAMVSALLVAMLLYAFPRFLSYMESKDLLVLEERRAPAFGFCLQLSIAPLMLYLAWMFRMSVLAELLAYFLAIHATWWLLVSAGKAQPQPKE